MDVCARARAHNNNNPFTFQQNRMSLECVAHTQINQLPTSYSTLTIKWWCDSLKVLNVDFIFLIVDATLLILEWRCFVNKYSRKFQCSKWSSLLLPILLDSTESLNPKLLKEHQTFYICFHIGGVSQCSLRSQRQKHFDIFVLSCFASLCIFGYWISNQITLKRANEDRDTSSKLCKKYESLMKSIYIKCDSNVGERDFEYNYSLSLVILYSLKLNWIRHPPVRHRIIMHIVMAHKLMVLSAFRLLS